MTVIDVYADICCPFAHVGLKFVARRRDLLGHHDVVMRVHAWPLELVNGAPLDAAISAEHVDHLRTQIAPELFAHFDPDHFPPTSLPAMEVAAAAYHRSDRIGEAVSLALREELFEEGRDVSRPDVLARVRNAHGLGDSDAQDEAAVLAEWHEGTSRGVKGSPHFFCRDIDAFCPSLEISRDGSGQVHLRRNTEALDTFLAHCFQA